MSRYIDAELAEAAMTKLYEEDVEMYAVEIPETFDKCRAISELRKIPAADVEEVRHGAWEEVTTNAIDDLAFDTVASMRCSKCGRYHNRVYHYGDPTEMEHYCSFCGAKMDGKEKNDGES